MVKKDSIKGIGLERYLYRTAAKHNGLTYKDFVFYMTLKKRPSASSLAGIFNVTDPTMRKWIGIYEEEVK